MMYPRIINILPLMLFPPLLSLRRITNLNINVMNKILLNRIIIKTEIIYFFILLQFIFILNF